MNDQALYLEADEDITSAIDKLRHATSESVHIVVPKRSGLLQSIINLKLLKKAAEASGKSLVLVTTDKVATDLAARTGLAVAPSVGAKAVVLEAAPPPKIDLDDEVITASDPAGPAAAADVVAAETAGNGAKISKALKFRHREVPDEESAGMPTPAMATAVAKNPLEAQLPETDVNDSAAAAKADGRRPGVKVPSYGKLKRRLFWVGLAMCAVVTYVGYMYFFATAQVVIFANATKTSIDAAFSIDPKATATQADKAVLAGKALSASRDLSASFTPTGKKDVGTKATGSVTISNCFDSTDHTFVEGTRFQSPDGKIFRSTAEVIVPGGQGSFFGCTNPGTATVAVIADQNGDSYNQAPATYTLPGLPMSQQTGQNSISAKGGQMSGGTSKTITVVTQADVDTAVAAAVEKDKDNIGKALDGVTPADFLVLAASRKTSTTDVVPSPAIDGEGTSATVTFKAAYMALAVKKAEYESLIRDLENKQVGGNNQIYDDGLKSAQLTADTADAQGKQVFHLTTDAYSGAKIDEAKLAKELAGKRYGDAVTLAARQPSVAHVEITLKPVWATSIPSRTDKIKVEIKVASGD